MTTYADELYIGTYAGGVAGMSKISSLGSPPIAEGSFTVDPVHRSAVTRLLDATYEENGWLQCSWHLNGLRGAGYEALIAYRTALTTRVYIRTLTNDGKTYANYLSQMIWQIKPNRDDESGHVFDFEIQFIQLVLQS